MQEAHRSNFIRNTATLTLFSFLLSGCLMGEEESKSDSNVIANHDLSGSVGDGPVVGASMRILRNDGVELGQVESDSSANYNITVRTYREFYPLTIDARNGTDIVTNAAPDFVLLGGVMEPGSASVANVNPFSTFAVELARDLPGGVNTTNLQTAQRIVSDEFNNGLAGLATSGVMTTAVDGSNVAEVVRSSEALGETVRRTRDALSASGMSASGDAVVHALSSDLTDSVVDGDGGPRADARIAAVAIIVSAQVLLETMANELHVNGVDATQAMNNAIDQVSVGSANPTLADLAVTGEMLSRARVGLVAAHAVTGDSTVAEILSALNGVQEGSSSSTVRNFALPSDYRGRLNNAISLVAGGSGAVVDMVNNISHDRTQAISGENRAPTIAGTPPGSVTTGSAYSFTPSAFDAEGGVLMFDIDNPPSWASFDATTGQIFGTPATGDVGVHGGIVISVSDGALSTSLPTFSITVNAIVSNAPPQISGSAPPDVMVGQTYSFTPTVSDADGDALSFTVSGLPSWASFDDTNGRINGTPQSGDVGTYAGISITVSDGQASTTLGPLTITVQTASSGSVTLSWTAPTQNEDGTTLTDLDGYKIYWGTTSGNYPNSVTIDNESVTTYVVDNLTSGTYEFVATSFNTSGVESGYSAPATKVVQ
ncbi:MAG: hypothetical protein GY783_03100 [Gammaproteobacteria bacterium]|nr:hypothetical protein [Gammaproteobacteria bacterium]